MKTKIYQLLCVVSCLACLTAKAETFHSLLSSSGFGPSGNGSITVGQTNFVTTGAIQRGMARNPVTGNLIFVDRFVAPQSPEISGTIYVLSGTDGSVVGTLSTNGIQGGSFADYAVGVSDDGVIYIGNVITSTNAGPVKIYRWESETTPNAPTVAFSGALGTNNYRWGNTIDVRGSGTSTEILVSSDGNEAAVLTTTDGISFIANVLKADFTATLQGSLNFGIGNTYWAKFSGLALKQLRFDLATKTATTIRSIGTPEMPEMDALEGAALDNVNHLLAVRHTHGGDPDEIFLYDIQNTNDLPQLLDSHTITEINNANSGSPHAYLTMGGGKLYSHILNNGIFAFDLLSNSIPAPAILTQPQPKSVLAGSTVKFRVIAQRGTGFQWRKGSTPIPGATNSVLVLTNVQMNATANYSVVVSNATDSVTSSSALLTILSPAETFHFTKIWSTAPAAQPYFLTAGGSASTPNQRSLAYNSLSNHLYVVARGGSSSANFSVHVIDAETGAPLYTLNTNGVNFTGFAGQIGLVGIDCTADGVIYACNVDSASPNMWRLYRWADGGIDTQPVQVFAGDPLNSGASSRWGDTLGVRGTGLDTEIIIDTQAAGPTSGFMAILKPTDASMSAFASTFWFPENPNGAAVGRSLQFGTGNTFWQRRRNFPLVLSSYGSDSPVAPIVSTNSNFPSTLGLVAVDQTRNLLGAININGTTGSTPDLVELYDISDLSNPALLSQTNMPVNRVANTGNIGEVIFGGDKMFALESQNGLLAMRIELGISAAPTLTVTRNGGSINLTWEGSGFILEGTTALTNPSWQPVAYEPGSPNTATDTVSGNARFYRLRK